MKFKYLSSDFLATYNEIYEELEAKQAQLDSTYHDKIEKLVQREKLRLDKIAPLEYEIGERVRTPGGKIGKIVATQIDFNVEVDETDLYGKPLYGPGRYFPIASASDEEVVTCEGVLRTYTIETEAHEIEKDWGTMSVKESFYSDEIAKIEE